METVSHNIANAENPDYVRRSTLLTDATVAGALNPFYQGADRAQRRLASSHRALVGRVPRSAGPPVGRLAHPHRNRRSDWLEQVETDLDNAGSNVGRRLNSFFGRGEELAAAPFDTALRLTFMTELDAMVDSFRRTSRNLELTLEQVGQAAFSELADRSTRRWTTSPRSISTSRAPRWAAMPMPGCSMRAMPMLAVITEKLDATITLSGNGIATVTYDGQTLAGGQFFCHCHHRHQRRWQRRR